MAATNYDTNGVLTSEGWITGTYNALNQPITINSASVSVSFGYDPLGRCVKRISGATTTYLYYDGWNLIQEGANYSSAARIYVHGNRVDEIVADQAGGVWSYHHYDARGHCILLTDASGNLVEQYSYDAFGKVYYYDGAGNALTDSARGNRFLFTGREWIKEIAVYDFRNRHYLPELGRFIQPDPKEFEAGDYNLYRYCHNDPVNKSDPTGLMVSMGAADRSATLLHVETNWETHTDSLIPQAVTTAVSIPLGGGWSGKGNLSMAQMNSAPSSHGPARQWRYESLPSEPSDQHGFFKTPRFQLVDSNGSPVRGHGYANREHLISHEGSSNVKLRTSEESQPVNLSSKGVLTDRVGPKFKPGSGANYYSVSVFGNTLYKDGSRSPISISTTFRHEISVVNGVPTVTVSIVKP
jgi:RHS repeat-associated protein